MAQAPLARFGITASKRSLEWTYVVVTMAGFVFMPELRRLLDWRGSFDPLNTLSVLPLLMLVPVAVVAYRRRDRIRSRMFWTVSLLWLSGFGYAAFVAFIHRAVGSPLYGLAEFCLPLAVGAWFVTCGATAGEAHARFARVLLVCGSVAAFYGVIQYVLAPPWDTAWMENSGAIAFGTPERFGIRVFSVLNGPEVFALFLGVVILFNLPYLGARNVWGMVGMLVMTIAMMLSLFRTAWIAVILGIVVFVLLAPDRLRTLSKLAYVVGFCILGATVMLIFSPDAGAGEKIGQRFATLMDVQNDYSFEDRAATRDEAIQKAIERPIGAGLGTTGSSARLGNADAEAINDVPDRPLDNGFAARFLEMGVVGFGAFMIAGALSLGALVGRYVACLRARDRRGMTLAASCLAVQVAIFMVNLSDDDMHGLLGLLFFVALALPLSTGSPSPTTAQSPSTGSSRGFRSRTAFV